MRNIYSRLSSTAYDIVRNLESKGWQFEDDYWEDHHKGDPYYDVKFKSPNMKQFASINANAWRELTLEYLLEREAHHAAHDWVKNIFDYSSVISNPVADGLKKHFLKTKSTEFKSLYSTDTKFDVKVKAKNNKPKKVKVTIEIL